MIAETINPKGPLDPTPRVIVVAASSAVVTTRTPCSSQFKLR